MLRERTVAGLAAAKRRGEPLERAPALTPAQVREAKKMFVRGERPNHVAASARRTLDTLSSSRSSMSGYVNYTFVLDENVTHLAEAFTLRAGGMSDNLLIGHVAIDQEFLPTLLEKFYTRDFQLTAYSFSVRRKAYTNLVHAEAQVLFSRFGDIAMTTYDCQRQVGRYKTLNDPS